MEWCCIGFKANYEAANEARFSIVVKRNSLGDPSFLLRYRVYDRGKEAAVLGRVPIVSDLGMQFCPWCGTKLDEWYGTHVDALTRPTDTPPFSPLVGPEE
jgi:hypothetical protein